MCQDTVLCAVLRAMLRWLRKMVKERGVGKTRSKEDQAIDRFRWSEKAKHHEKDTGRETRHGHRGRDNQADGQRRGASEKSRGRKRARRKERKSGGESFEETHKEPRNTGGCERN